MFFRFDGEVFRILASWNFPPEVHDMLERRPLRPGHPSAIGRAGASLKPVCIPDVLEDPHYGLTGEQNKLHNGAATHLHPTRARELIREKAQAGLRRLDEIPKFWLKPPYELVSVLRRTDDEPQKRAVCRADDLLELLGMPRQHE